ncbi:MAG: hypothetical protein AAFW64_08285 [Pseudomonadota bacterium]
MTVGRVENRSGILIVEDQLLLAMDLSRSVAREGYHTLGPCKDVDTALDVLSDATPEAAILDINLGSGTTSEVIADALVRMGVPFAFLSAYSEDIPIIDRFPDALFVNKPINARTLKTLLESLAKRANGRH